MGSTSKIIGDGRGGPAKDDAFSSELITTSTNSIKNKVVNDENQNHERGTGNCTKKIKQIKGEIYDNVEIINESSNSSVLSSSKEEPNKFENQFKGERGGSAEDADLLAELRNISMISSKNRFETNEDNSQEDDAKSLT